MFLQNGKLVKFWEKQCNLTLSWIVILSTWIGVDASEQNEQFGSVATRKDGAGSGNPIFLSSERWTLEKIQQCTHDKWPKVLRCSIFLSNNVFVLSLPSNYNTLTSWVEGTWHMVGLWICHSSDNSQVFQREVLRSRRNSTTVVNRPNMVQYFIKSVLRPNLTGVWITELNVFMSTCILLYRSLHHRFGSPAPDFIRLNK